MAVVRNLMVRAGADFSKMRTEMKRAANDLNKFKNSVNKTLKWIGSGLAAFGVGKFLKDSVSAINHTIEQETKLATVMRQRMKATDDMIQSIHRLTAAQESLGVVSADAQKAGAAELATYLGQSQSLKVLIPALNNLTAAQYGFNAGAQQTVGLATMLGKVMDGQTGALSRYGFTFDEAQEKILKYGTEAQRASLLADIITDSLGNMNEELRKTPQGQMLALKNTLGAIKSEIGRGLLPVIQKVLPYLQAVANWFLRAAQAVSAFTAALFGKAEVPNTMAVQTEGVEGLGDAYKDAGEKAKKAQKSVAGFDQLNVVGDKKSDADNAVPDGGGIGGLDLDNSGIISSMSEVGDKAAKMAEKVKNAYGQMKTFIQENSDIIISVLAGVGAAFTTAFAVAKWGAIVEMLKKVGAVIASVFRITPIGLLITAIGALVAAIVYLWRTNDGFREAMVGAWESVKAAAIDVWERALVPLGNFFQWLWESVLVPFGAWLIDVMPIAWDAVKVAAMDVWERALVPLGNFLQWLWDNVFAPFGAWLMDVMPKAWDAVVVAAMWLWKNVLVPFGEFLKWLWDKVLVPVGKVIGEALVIAFDKVAKVAKSFWNDVLVPLGKALMEMVGPAVEAVSAVLTWLWLNVLKPLGSFIGAILMPIIEGLVAIFEFLWKYVLKPLVNFVGNVLVSVFTNAFKSIGGIIGGVKDIFVGLMKFITGIFTGDWKKAWDGVKQIFKGVFDSLWSIVKFPLNLIIDGINALIGGLNKLSFDIPDWVPGSLGGKSFGISIPKIPKLAVGTNYVAEDGLAYLHEGEAVVPKKYNPAAGGMAPSSDNREIASLLKSILKAVKDGGQVQVNLSKTAIGQAAIEVIRDKHRQTGQLPFPV